MTQTQFLLFITSIIPFLNCFAIKLGSRNARIVDASIIIFPILFLISIFGLNAGLGNGESSHFLIGEAIKDIYLGFFINQSTVSFLFLLGFIWIVFAVYLRRFLHLTQMKNSHEIKIFFVLVVALLNLIILSKNLLTILFFYNCLVILSHFFALRFLHKKRDGYSHLFTILLYLESVLLFLAIAATYKITGQIDFVSGGLIGKISQTEKLILLFLYVGGLFLSVLFPSFLIYRRVNFDPIITYILFFLAYGFSSLYVISKVITSIFGLKGFAIMIYQTNHDFLFTLVEMVFLINIGASLMFLLLSKNFASSFFYLFFQQLLFALFAIFIFASFDGERLYLVIISFATSLTLIFLCCSNLNFYLTKEKIKVSDDNSLNQHWYGGIYKNMKITTLLLIFGLLGLIGLAPSIAAVEIFVLAKTIYRNGLMISGMVFLLNFIGIALFSLKMIFTIFDRKQENGVEMHDQTIAKNIDSDSSLILTVVTVAIVMIITAMASSSMISVFG